MPLKLLPLTVLALLMSGCSASNGGAACAVYLGSPFTVDPVHDTSATVIGFSDLDEQMVAACQ